MRLDHIKVKCKKLNASSSNMTKTQHPKASTIKIKGMQKSKVRTQTKLNPKMVWTSIQGTHQVKFESRKTRYNLFQISTITNNLNKYDFFLFCFWGTTTSLKNCKTPPPMIQIFMYMSSLSKFQPIFESLFISSKHPIQSVRMIWLENWTKVSLRALIHHQLYEKIDPFICKLPLRREGLVSRKPDHQIPSMLKLSITKSYISNYY